MDLKEYCYSLSSNDLYTLAIKMCENALIIWDDYALKNKLYYRDTVIGLSHTVRTQLLSDTIQFCKETHNVKFTRSTDFDKLLEEFSDPIVSIQDSDWELPYPVEKTFHAVYNLLKGDQEQLTNFDELTHYVSVNQAVDAITEHGRMPMKEIKDLIYS